MCLLYITYSQFKQSRAPIIIIYIGFESHLSASRMYEHPFFAGIAPRPRKCHLASVIYVFDILLLK